ncbi:MAG: cation diffusion facilitator family transporter [Chloroflexi bacterium]|nr:cation diffusion facilitator family transporter [Chloroflexota bacterium]
MGNHQHVIERDERSLLIALGITSTIFLAELVGGIVSNSLALVADAVHMFTDIVALALGWFAVWLTTKPAPPQKTYGYYRMEILVALFNGVLLILVSLFISFEAVGRLQSPQQVESGLMLAVALIGLAANVGSALVLFGKIHESINVRAAFLHVMSDATASLGAIAAAVAILLTGVFVADPAISLLIAALIIYNAAKLVMEAIDVLMESAPAHINLKELEETLLSAPGVKSVHDLHVWTVTSGLVALSGHVVVEPGTNRQEILERCCSALENKYHLNHCTLQLEIESPKAHEEHFW